MTGGPASAADMPGTGSKRRAAIRSRAVTLSPTGQSWAAATTEGLLLYSLDQGLVFDPTDLTEDITPAAAFKALSNRAFVRALLIALRLKDPDVVRHVIMSTPPNQVRLYSAQCLASLKQIAIQGRGAWGAYDSSAHLMWGVCIQQAVACEWTAVTLLLPSRVFLCILVYVYWSNREISSAFTCIGICMTKVVASCSLGD